MRTVKDDVAVHKRVGIFQENFFRQMALAILIFFLAGLTPKSSFSQPKTMSIAVLSFANTTKESKYDYLSRTIAESLSTLLIKYSRDSITVVERLQVEKALKETGFQLAGYTDINSAVEVGKLTNATHVLIGSFTVIDSVIQINARLISVETGEAIAAESVTGKGGKESFNQINKLSARIIEHLTELKVKIESFKDVQNPFEQIQSITKKKSNLLWIVLGVAVVAGIALSLGRSEQKATQTVNINP